MLPVIFVILVVILIILLKFDDWFVDEYVIGEAIVGLIAAVVFAFILCDANELIKGRTYDASIALYEEENAKIEEQVQILVSEYIEHETELTKLGTENADIIVLAELYPEVKSSVLVQQQIEIYCKNRQQIIELKEKKIRLAECRFRLYFGR